MRPFYDPVTLLRYTGTIEREGTAPVCKQRRHYLSYLLRLWQAQGKDDLVWRASLEGARTGERLGFTTLEDLFDFVREQTLDGSDSEPNPETQENDRTAEKGDAP